MSKKNTAEVTPEVTPEVAGEEAAGVAPASEEAAAPAAPATDRRAGSVKRVHEICAANPNATRKEIMEMCEREGIRPTTASTQIQAWRKKNGLVTARPKTDPPVGAPGEGDVEAAPLDAGQ